MKKNKTEFKLNILVNDEFVFRKVRGDSNLHLALDEEHVSRNVFAEQKTALNVTFVIN